MTPNLCVMNGGFLDYNCCYSSKKDGVDIIQILRFRNYKVCIVVLSKIATLGLFILTLGIPPLQTKHVVAICMGECKTQGLT